METILGVEITSPWPVVSVRYCIECGLAFERVKDPSRDWVMLVRADLGRPAEAGDGVTECPKCGFSLEWVSLLWDPRNCTVAVADLMGLDLNREVSGG